MPAQIKVVGMYQKVKNLSETQDCYIIDTTSKGGIWSGLSPFSLGPCNLYPDPKTGATMVAQNMENAWQFSKLYKKHTDDKGGPTDEYWEWAKPGWADAKPHRYPMGRGARPECSLWGEERLLYIDARKTIYAPLYAEAVQKGQAWRELKGVYEQVKLLILRDYDGYDHAALGMSLSEVLNNPAKKMGHAFVLMMLLTGDDALKQIKLRT